MAATLILIQWLLLESCDTRGWGLLVSCCDVGSRPSSGRLRTPPPIHLRAAWMWSLLIKQRCSVALFPSAGEEDDQTKRRTRGEFYRGPVMLQSLRRHLASITHLGFVTLLSRSFFTRPSVFFPPLLLLLFGLLLPLALCVTPVYGLFHFPPVILPFFPLTRRLPCGCKQMSHSFINTQKSFCRKMVMLLIWHLNCRYKYLTLLNSLYNKVRRWMPVFKTMTCLIPQFNVFAALVRCFYCCWGADYQL